MDAAETTLPGSAFQVLEAATGKARLPIVYSLTNKVVGSGGSECASTRRHIGRSGTAAQRHGEPCIGKAEADWLFKPSLANSANRPRQQ